jgi:hypothetical protein
MQSQVFTAAKLSFAAEGTQLNIPASIQVRKVHIFQEEDVYILTGNCIEIY